MSDLVRPGSEPEESAARLRRVLDHLIAFVGVLTPEGVLVEVNETALRAAGVRREDVLGRPVEDTVWIAYSEDSRAAMREAVRAAAAGETVRFDTTIRVADERLITIDFSLVPVKDRSGRVIELIASGADISARKRAEEEQRLAQERFETLFRAAPEAISLSDFDSGRILDVNEAFCAMFGFRREEIVGRTAIELGLWTDLAKRAQIVASLRAGEPVVGCEARARHRSGDEFDVRFSAERLRMNGGDYLLLMFDDVSERKRAEEALREANRRLHALSVRLVEAQEAERAAIARDLHDELGQALTALMLRLQTAARRAPEALAAALAECSAIVEQVLAQVRGLALDLRPPELDQLGLDAALREYARRAAARAGFEVEVQADRDYRGLDRGIATAAFRIVQEALTNAARHSGAKRVKIELAAEGDALLLAVTDDGGGFDPQEARTRSLEGASMGLAAMAERAALAGGRLEIRARPGAGTRIEARFALTPPSLEGAGGTA